MKQKKYLKFRDSLMKIIIYSVLINTPLLSLSILADDNKSIISSENFEYIFLKDYIKFEEKDSFNNRMDSFFGIDYSLENKRFIDLKIPFTSRDIRKIYNEKLIQMSIKETRKFNPKTTIEVLTPDFLRKGDSYKKVIKANPDVFNHNIETVPSLYRKVRPGSRYFSSLELLKKAKEIDKNIFTKSGLMVGLGENKDEIVQVMDDLISADVDFLTIGQYLQPSEKHHPLIRYYHPQEFEELKMIAKSKGFLLVSSSPLTRSSYHADDDFKKLKKERIEKTNAQSIS